MNHDDWDELERIDRNIFTNIWLVVFPFVGIAYYIFLSDTLSKALGIHFLLTLLIVIAYAALKLAIPFGIMLLRFKKRIRESLMIAGALYCILGIIEFFLSWEIVFFSDAFQYPEIRLLIVMVGSSLLLLTPVRLPFYIKIVKDMLKDPNEFRQRVKGIWQEDFQEIDTEQPTTDSEQSETGGQGDTEKPLAPEQKKCWACDTVQSASNIYCENCHEKL